MKIKASRNFNCQYFLKLISLFSLSFFLIQCVHKNEQDLNKNTDQPVISREPATNKSPFPVFEICSSEKKLYLEQQILKMPKDYYTDHEKDWDKKIPIQCIQFAQKNFQGSYAYCENEESKLKMGYARPCLSEAYTRLTYNAYHDVKNCFNLDPRSSFLQIMIESGFHVNAINRTGYDAGVSQFTKNGMQRVLERDLVEKTRRILLESSNPSCQRIASVIGKLDVDSFTVDKRCSMIALPQNPYRGFLMHYLHSLRDQIFFKQKLVEIRPEIESILTPQMIEQFVYFAYNRGITGTLRLIDGYYKNRKASGQKVQASDFVLWQNLSDVRAIMKREPATRKLLKTSKIKKLTFPEYAVIQNQSYMANMSEARDFVRRHLKNQCVD